MHSTKKWEYNGYYEYSGKNISEERYYKNFIVFDEGTSLRNREQFKRVFNSDENKNGKLDKNLFGAPTEAYGFSNNARETFSSPSFEAAKVVLDRDKKCQIRIK